TRGADAALYNGPRLLLGLVESDWEATRAVAFELLRARSRSADLSLDGLVGLLDSNRIDVQDMGKELAGQHLDALPKAELATRLIEHPHPNMRRFVLDLVVEHLPAGADSLAALEPFFRAAWLDLR